MQRDKVGLVAVALFLLAVAWILASAVVTEEPVIASFEECVSAGFPVAESYPRQCAAYGTTFVESAPSPAPTPECALAGCNNEICIEGVEAPFVVTACAYEASFACLPAFSRCERQPNGHCGWTPNDELSACILDPEASLADDAPKQVL